MTELIPRLIAQVKIRLEKRGKDSSLTPYEVKSGTAYKTSDTLIFIPEIVSDTISKVKNETLNLIYYVMEGENIHHTILLYDEIAPQASEIVRTHPDVFRIELIQYKFSLFDPTTSRLVPRHEKMTEQQIREELTDSKDKEGRKKPSIKLSDIPHLLLTDAIVRYYDWLDGDIIKVIRVNFPPCYKQIVSQTKTAKKK